MQHFVRVMQSYIAHQVIFVTWNEFKASMKTDLNNLDDLIKIHDDYLNRAIFRSEGFSRNLTYNLLPFYHQKLNSKFKSLCCKLIFMYTYSCYTCNDNAICWFCRCLLNTKAAKVMKIIRDMFGLILQFRSLLVAADWTRDKTTGEMSHANFNQMLKCFQNFKQYSVFLFKGMNFLKIINLCKT